MLLSMSCISLQRTQEKRIFLAFLLGNSFLFSLTLFASCLSILSLILCSLLCDTETDKLQTAFPRLFRVQAGVGKVGQGGK